MGQDILHLWPGESRIRRDNKRCHACQLPVEVGGREKMSKSKKNVVSPDDVSALGAGVGRDRNARLQPLIDRES